MSAPHVIYVRPFRRHFWEANDGPGCCPFYANRVHAISFATSRLAGRDGEVRVMNAAGEVVEVIPSTACGHWLQAK